MKIQLLKSQEQGQRWISCLKEPTFSQKSQLVKLTQKLRKSQLFETNLDLDHHFPYDLSTLAVLHLYSFRYLRIWHALAVNTDQFLLLIHKQHCFHSTVLHFYWIGYLRIWHTLAVLDFWSVSVTHIHKQHRFHSSVVHLYHCRYLQIWHP